MGAITEGEWRYNRLIKHFPSEPDPAVRGRAISSSAGGVAPGAAPPTWGGSGSC